MCNGHSGLLVTRKMTHIKYLKSLSKFQKSILIISLLSLMFSLYLYSTTNRLHDKNLNDLLSKTYVIGWVILTLSFLSLLISQRKSLFQFLKLYIILITCTTILVAFFGFSPCMFLHPSNYDHVHPHTLEYTLKQSLLCPNYSQPGKLMLVILITIEIGMYLIIRVISKEYPVTNTSYKK